MGASEAGGRGGGRANMVVCPMVGVAVCVAIAIGVLAAAGMLTGGGDAENIFF